MGLLVGDGVFATTNDGDLVDAITRDGMTVAIEDDDRVVATTKVDDGDGDGATNEAWADDPNASFCDNTLIT